MARDLAARKPQATSTKSWSAPHAPPWLTDPIDFTTGEAQPGAWRPPAVVPSRTALLSLQASLQAALQPTSREWIIANLTRLAAHFWGEASEAQWHIRFRDYAADLAEYPADILEATFGEMRQSSKWWPKLAEIIAVARPALEARKRQVVRLERMAAPPSRQPSEARGQRWTEMTAEQRSEFDRRIAGLMSKWPSHRPTT